MGAALSDRIMALARIIGTVSADAADLLACRDLGVGQDRDIANVSPGDLDRPKRQCLLVGAKVDLARRAVWGRRAGARATYLRP